MAGVMERLGETFLSIYKGFMATLPEWAQHFIALFILVLLIVIYALFIWKFYRFISSKNILKLDLKQYSKSEHAFFAKLIVGALNTLEYMIILPFLIFFWFSVFTLFLIVLTENIAISQILMISAIVIASIRMTAYANENLAIDLAKMIPFTLLSVSILNPNFFNVERIFSHFKEIPLFFNNIAIYLLFIIILEAFLRFFEFILSLFELEDIEIPDEKEK